MRLRQIRFRRGWTQAELGERVGLQQTQVSKHELGQLDPSTDQLLAYAKALGCTVDEILGAEDADARMSNAPEIGGAPSKNGQESTNDAPTSAPTVPGGGDAMAQPTSALGDADPLVLLSRALRLLELREANDRVRIEQHEQTQRQRIEQVEAVNAASLRAIVEQIQSRSSGGPSDKGEQEA